MGDLRSSASRTGQGLNPLGKGGTLRESRPSWAASVRLATPVPAEAKQAASAELDRTVRQVFALANRHLRWEFNDLARRLDN
jgi:hypothetical protein